MAGFFNNAQGVVIHNGNFVNNIVSREPQSPWDRLQAAASPSAFFNSGDQLDAPKCHPNTRVAILDELRDFALSRGDMALVKALWLRGPAGAGKSAIARSLCEELHAANALLASYFFKQTDSSRNTHKSFVANITYEIYGTVPEPYRALILAVIQKDPLIFTRSLTTQWDSLITHSLRELFESNYFHDIGRRLIVIDGLDECSTAAAQVSILKEIQRISLAGSPFLFFVASRPEHDIQSFLSSTSWKSPGCLLYRLDLEASYQADEDIRRFLVDKLHEVCLDHPHKNDIPAGWPPAHAIQTLVGKASGLFIYAFVVIEYIVSNRHQPHKRLDMVLGLRPPKGGLPFAELDTLYEQILSSCQDVDLALEIIVFASLTSREIELFAMLNSLDIDDCKAALCDLLSILDISPRSFRTSTVRHQITLMHKSLVDYLHNSRRSGKYYRDESLAIYRISELALRFTSDARYFSDNWFDRIYVYSFVPKFFEKFLPQLLQNIHVSQHGFMLLSLQDWYKSTVVRGRQSLEKEFALFRDDFWDLFPTLIRGLKQLATTDHKYVYDYYQAQFRDLNAALPNLCTAQPSEDYLPDRQTAIDAISVMFISYYPDFPMPHSYAKLLSSLDTRMSEWKCVSHFQTQVEHDTALQCIDLLYRPKSTAHTAEDASVLRATLRALALTLPNAKYSSTLYRSACIALQSHDWFAPFGESEGYPEADNTQRLAEEIAEVAESVDTYRRRCKQKLGIVE